MYPLSLEISLPLFYHGTQFSIKQHRTYKWMTVRPLHQSVDHVHFSCRVLTGLARIACIARAALWTLLDLESRGRSGCMSDSSIIKMPAESGIGNDRLNVRILSSDQKTIGICKQVAMLRRTGIQVIYRAVGDLYLPVRVHCYVAA